MITIFCIEVLDRLQIGTINQNQTAIGAALGTALNRLRKVKAKSKIVILMTDGQNNAGKIDSVGRGGGGQGAEG